MALRRAFAVRVLLSILFVLIAPLRLAAQSGPVNLDFREGQLGETPRGWLFRNTDGYSAKLIDRCRMAGSQCVEIRADGTGKAPFVTLTQGIDAAAYRNKTVRYRAFVRVEPGSRAQLWLRVDLPDRRRGFFDNMDSRPILSAEWAEYEINGDVDRSAEKIYFGILMPAGGTAAFITEASLEATGTSETTPIEPPRPLSSRGLENLTAYARLFGYVRHFYPGDEAAKADWDAVAIAGARAVEDAANPKELAARLEEFFHPVAPGVRVFPAAQKPPKVDPDLPAGHKDLQLISWKHRGFGGGGAAGQTYQSERVTAPAVNGRLLDPFAAEIGAGLHALVPLAVFTSAKGTLPAGSNQFEKKAAAATRHTGDDRGTRLADVVIAWNVFQHFYPYFDVVKTDWPAALTAALQTAATDKNAAEFVATLQRLVAALRDGHGRVNSRGMPLGRAPVGWTWVEGRLVVTYVPDAQGQPVAPGDRVVAINGKPVAEAMRQAEALVSAATPQWRLSRVLNEIGIGPADQPLALELESFREPHQRYTVSLKRQVSQPPPVLERRPPPAAELKAGLIYFDLTRNTDDEWKKWLPRLEAASAIIFDMRGYPGRLSPIFLQHLSQTAMTSAQWHVPVVTGPDHRDIKFDRGGEWKLAPASPYLKARRVFLTDGRAISYAESCMGIVEHYRLGHIVGGPTAGTNGNVNPVTLPGQYTISWTGMKVLKHDGSQHHGIGILPTVPVSRTQAGIAAGRDEVLERALELLSQPGN